MPRHRFLLASALITLGACPGPTGPDGAPPLLTELPRPLSSGELGIVDGANAFTFDLFRQAAGGLDSESNLFLSPLSATMALGMALNGANGDTYDGMRAVLRMAGLAEVEINAGYRDLTTLLRGLDSRTEMRIANSMWVREGLPLEPAFQADGRTYFDAETTTLDFGAPEAAETINGWVSDKTGGRIPRLIERIDADEVLLLINAIYFKGKWRQAFDRGGTRSGVFHGGDGVDRTAPLMYQEASLPYHETDRFQAVDLPYGNGAFAMTVLLPKPGGGIRDVVAGLDDATWRSLGARFQDAEVRLTLPRFRAETTRRLDHDLSAMGMTVAFDRGRADFYRIADVRPERLFISRVEQKTFVEVTEEGTEAAAATTVGVGVTSAPLVVEMRVDRPFVFAIRERLSGAVLFIGVMQVVGE